MPADFPGYPYDDTVVYITDTIGGVRYQGSGVLISPDEVLTASHVVWSAMAGAASNIKVTPGYEAGTAPVGSEQGASFNFNPVDDSGGFLTFTQSQSDFAVIHLAQPFSVGSMGLDPDFTAGMANVSGYPATAKGALVTQTEAFTQVPGYSLLTSGGLGPGSSGGPVWVENADGSADVVGIVSTGNNGGAGYFTEITPGVVTAINAWVGQQNGLPAGASGTPALVAVPADDGMAPRSLSASDQSTLNLAEFLRPASQRRVDDVHRWRSYRN